MKYDHKINILIAFTKNADNAKEEILYHKSLMSWKSTTCLRN